MAFRENPDSSRRTYSTLPLQPTAKLFRLADQSLSVSPSVCQRCCSEIVFVGGHGWHCCACFGSMANCTLPLVTSLFFFSCFLPVATSRLTTNAQTEKKHGILSTRALTHSVLSCVLCLLPCASYSRVLSVSISPDLLLSFFLCIRPHFEFPTCSIFTRPIYHVLRMLPQPTKENVSVFYIHPVCLTLLFSPYPLPLSQCPRRSLSPFASKSTTSSLSSRCMSRLPSLPLTPSTFSERMSLP